MVRLCLIEHAVDSRRISQRHHALLDQIRHVRVPDLLYEPSPCCKGQKVGLESVDRIVRCPFSLFVGTLAAAWPQNN